MKYRMIQVGTGGWGGAWCGSFIPPNIKDGLVEVVAAVDTNPEALKNAQQHLGIRADQCYTDIGKAFDENKADFCTVVVPPAFHESVVDMALNHDMHILSEKPISDTLENSIRIANKVKNAGKKMGVTMSHRFRQDITTLREEIRSGKYGDLDYLICRFTCECRTYGAWGKFRYEIPDPLMIEGAVHHLDLLADMAANSSSGSYGGKCKTIYAQTWQPSWGKFSGDAQALVIMGLDNGSRSFYEGAKTNAVGLNCWGAEYIRAECEKATFILSYGKIEGFNYDPTHERANRKEGTGKDVPLLQQLKWANTWLIEKFVRWLDGGEIMETNVEDNLQSVALIFAAIESNKTGQPIQVQDFLSNTRSNL